MDEDEKKNRIRALHEATEHRQAGETPDQTLENANRYFQFLQGTDTPEA